MKPIILSGKKAGLEFRNNLELDELDKTDEKINILLPNVLSVHSSFIIGLIIGSIEHLGLDKFEEKYTIQNIQGENKELDKYFNEIEEAKTRIILKRGAMNERNKCR